MKQLAASFALSVITTAALAQPQILNSGFENWQNVGTGTEEPEEWSSIKTSDGGTIINNFAPQVCWRSDDAHTGAYSVNVRTVNSPIGAANGIVTCGRVHAEFDPANGRVFTDPNDPQWHQVMTDRPDSLVGWYKTTVQTGDHPRVDAIVHTGAASMPENGTLSNWVGRARFDAPSITLGEWTRFAVPFNYLSGAAPEHLLMVMSSGDSLLSQVGTQTWYDDIALIYNVACTPSETVVTVSPINDGTLDVAFSTSGTPVGPTTFTVQLSDASGDFTSPTIIGSTVSSEATGSIPCAIPAGTATGSGYAIRVVTDSPFYAPVGCGVEVDLLSGVEEVEHPWLISGGAGQIFIDGSFGGGTFSLLDAQGRLLLEGRLNPGRNAIATDHHGLITVVMRSGEAQLVDRVLLMR
ncbi:MAG TPA: hypothetical protein PKY96_12890 [Flavobacteriales bacterium]|nr:hypothetical protein [Flavobacteriales bacterium]